MLYPSIDELTEIAGSRYSLVTISSKRSIDLRERNNPQLENYTSKKELGKALEELKAGKIHIK